MDGPRAALTVLKADLRLVLAALAEAQRERDEARLAATRWREGGGHIEAARVELLVERDAAQAEAAKLRDQIRGWHDRMRYDVNTIAGEMRAVLAAPPSTAATKDGTMKRVVLFVQTGDEKPTSYAMTEALVTKEWIEGDGSGFVDSHLTLAAKNGADRWWLVECLDAEHGRAVIAGSRTLDSPEMGRILASGTAATPEEKT